MNFENSEVCEKLLLPLRELDVSGLNSQFTDLLFRKFIEKGKDVRDFRIGEMADLIEEAEREFNERGY